MPIPFLLLAGCLSAPAADDAPITMALAVEELGDVHWTRGISAAQARAAKSDRPVLVLFDEVPGCSTVKGFGRTALTHPLLVEAVETLFEPVVVYNNTPGDASTCRAYGEPRWNNPVVRYLDAENRDVSERFAGPYTEAAFARSMVNALGSEAPPWLLGVTEELEGLGRADTATFSMACFWSGEAHLGAADGVLATRTGWQGGREVVEVTFDRVETDRASLGVHASRGGARPMTSGQLSPTLGDDVYRLRKTPWASVPMTARQATVANALLSGGSRPDAVFSPRQRALVGGAVANLGRGGIREAFDRRGFSAVKDGVHGK